MNQNFEKIVEALAKNKGLTKKQHKKYRGLYAVLGGEINLAKNLGPDDLKIAEKQNIKTSRIAKGIPIGGMLDYMDEETLESAFNNRK